MAPMAPDTQARRAFVDKLIELGTKASRPDVDEPTRQSSRQEFDDLVKKTGTSTLIEAFTFLIQPGRVPPELRTKFLQELTRIPLREDGVRATAEFVFSVHPSSTVGSSEEATAQKTGANITQEGLNMAAKMIAYPPASVSEDEWYRTVAPQLFALLDGKDGPELMKVAAYVIGFGILGRKQSGSPGTAGWKYVAEPILSPINPSIRSGSSHIHPVDKVDDVVDLSKPTVLVTAEQLAQSLYRLQALLISHPNPSLSGRLLRRVMMSLWGLASWIHPQSLCEERYCQPAHNLLKIYSKIAAGPAELANVAQNLFYKGDAEAGAWWTWEEIDSGGIQVVKPRRNPDDRPSESLWGELDAKVGSFIELVKSVCAEEEISWIFSNLFTKWFSANNKSHAIEILPKENDETPNPVALLTQVNVLQKMMESFPSQLASQPESLLGLIEPILNQHLEEEDETIPVALSLLNIVVTAPTFENSNIDKKLIQSIETSLGRLSSGSVGDIAVTARNLSLLLKYRDELGDVSQRSSGPTKSQMEDRKTYSLALSYITQADSPPPVRAEGLNLLQTLVVNNSPILDVTGTLVLLSSLLQDDEDYINLKVIKIFTLLANKHPRSVTKELLERYVDANEMSPVDTRLRFGEALLQVIERLGETFVGDTARQVSEALLSTAGRRGYRPKTEQKQMKDERLRQMKQKRAEHEWGGQVPDLGDDEADEQEENKELLTQLISGWDSKKGSEDIRIRASALSILAVGIETNVVGVGPALVTASVDLSVNVLTMESGMEIGILRRSAVLVILGFVRALNKAKETGRTVGFGLTEASQADIKRVLAYISETDNDELVRQHARDVIESLDNWTVGSLISESRGPDSTLGKLAGLSVDPERSFLAGRTNSRPQIEEID